MAELNRWLGAQKLSGVDRSAQTRQVHIKSPRIHLHTPPNPTCSRRYDHEWLKADYKPDPALPPISPYITTGTCILAFPCQTVEVTSDPRLVRGMLCDFHGKHLVAAILKKNSRL